MELEAFDADTDRKHSLYELEHLSFDDLVNRVYALENRPNLPDVVITVRGGVAVVAKCPDEIFVQIIDLD